MENEYTLKTSSELIDIFVYSLELFQNNYLGVLFAALKSPAAQELASRGREALLPIIEYLECSPPQKFIIKFGWIALLGEISRKLESTFAPKQVSTLENWLIWAKREAYDA